jgi:putative Ca2+/H+ antiporter (TMEM165/GDT1 family)
MQALINSFLLVFASEMGDKTQLLALLLATRYKKPWTILLGVFIATVLNHALATWAGAWVSTLVTHQTLINILAGIFFIFGLWILIPDKEEEFKERGHFGALVTTIIAFFLAEMGDKTQLATIALGARYQDIVMVTMGTTIGMMGSNALAIFLGEKLLRKVPMKWVRVFSCVLFIAFGIGILIKG